MVDPGTSLVVVGYAGNRPIVMDVDTGRVGLGAINVEHEIGPKTQAAVEKLSTAIQSLQRPAQRTAMAVAGTIAAGLVVASVIYLWSGKRGGGGKRKRKRTTRR